MSTAQLAGISKRRAQGFICNLAPYIPLTGVPGAAAGCVRLILAGKVLQDAQPLSAYGIGPTSRVLVTRCAPAASGSGAASAPPVSAEEEKRVR